MRTEPRAVKRQPPREILLVHNGDSGRARDACRRASRIFRAGGHTVTLVHEATPQRLTEALTELLRGHALHVGAVVAVGGDGMAHLVLQVLHRVGRQGVDVAFGLVPAGSGNDLARFHGLARDVERAAGRVLRGLESPPLHMDLLRVRCADDTEHVCATTVCLGLDAAVNARANSWSRVRASAKYAVALAVEALGMRAHGYRLGWTGPDGTSGTRDRPASFLTVTNTSSYGGGLTIVPRADPRDGCAELFAVAEISALRLARLIPHLFLGTHERLPEVELLPVTGVTVADRGPAGPGSARRGSRARLAHGDGEALGPLPVSVTVLPAAIRVLF